MAESNEQSQNPRKGFRFWLIVGALLLSTFFAILEAYSVSNALPVVVADLRADSFIWTIGAYGIASTALLPLSGVLADVYGRRVIMLGAVGLFALGGALCGAAQSMNMLIAARAIQGAGAGGIYTLSQVILSDIVTLEERGTYNAFFISTWAVSGCIGPLVGGALANHTTWRWLFYLNVPASGLIAAILLFALRLNKPPSLTFSQALTRLDGIGNTIVMGATCAAVIGLTWGGVMFPWISAQVLVPLCFGVVGLIVFMLYEWRFSEFPAVPLYLLVSNRTSLSGHITLCASINITLIYYLPVYYQACKAASPLAAGVDTLGITASIGPPAVIAGASIVKTKCYRPQLWFAWCCILLGVGLMSTINENTSRAASIGFQIPTGVGIGIISSVAYFPVLAPLPTTSTARALAFFVFLRTFSQIWGVTIGGTILQNGLEVKLPDSVKNTFPSLNNVAYAIIPLVSSMEQPAKDLTRRAFAASLGTVWHVLIVVAGVGLLASLMMEGLPLHTQKDEDFAMKSGEADEEKS
ncbi:Mfs1.2 [Ganoderma leucocontextum]|nr:Mfs1.2 [Ganoderma leucocontextum]